MPGLSRFLLTLSLLVCTEPARAWSEPAHRAIGVIAERLLTKDAAKKAHELLALDNSPSLGDVAGWADLQRAARPDTTSWHGVAIPYEAERFDAARDCPGDICLIPQLDRMWRLLASDRAAPAQRAEALKWVVHLVGDLHQPLDVTDRRDGFGSGVKVRFFGVPTSLHAVWEGAIIARMGTRDPLAERLSAAIRPDEIKAWSTGDLVAWAEEAHALGQSVAYGRLTPGLDLGQSYQAAAAPVVELQIKRAGVRLAVLLNSAFDAPRESWWRLRPAGDGARN